MSVRSAAIWAMASQYLAFAISFAASVYLARTYIDPAELGLFSIAFASTTLVATLQDFGLNRYITGSSDLDETRIRTAYSVSIVVAGIIAVAAVALAWPMAWIYGQPRLVPLILVIGSSYLLVPFAIVPTALRQRALDFKSNTLIEVGAALANAIVSIELARRGSGALALAWGAFAQQAARVAISQWRNGVLLPWPLRFAEAGPVMRFGGGSSLLLVSGSLGSKLPDLVIGRIIGEAAVGLFARASGLASQLRMLVSGAVAGVFYPAFARVRDRGEPLGPPYQRVVACYCAITWPAMAGLAVVAEPLVRLLYGEHWVGAAPLLQSIAIAQILFVALPLHIELPILLGRMRPLVSRCYLDTAVSIGLLLISAPFGLEWVAFSRVIYAIAWFAIFFRFLHRLIGFDAPALARDYSRSAVATCASVAPLLAIYALWQRPGDLGLTAMLGGTLAGIACWIAALRATRHPAYNEISAILAQSRSRLGLRSI